MTADHAAVDFRMDRPLVLGSGSPRRAALLREAGVVFEQRTAAFDEAGADVAGLSVAERVRRLAEGKAEALAAELSREGRDDGAVILTADTLLSLDGEALGKPADAEHARQMLTQLMARAHEAVTAVCVIDLARGASSGGAGERRALVDVAEVRIEPVQPAELERYLASGEWRGKAGGYNLAELEGRWRFSVRGDPSTVVGLPMRRLGEVLGARGVGKG